MPGMILHDETGGRFLDRPRRRDSEIAVSNHPSWKVGEIAESMSFGWQEWAVLTRLRWSPWGEQDRSHSRLD
jgi:hypothetical protein